MPSYRHIWILGKLALPPALAELIVLRDALKIAGVALIGNGTPISVKEGATELWIIPCKTHTLQVRYYQGDVEVVADVPTVDGTQLENQIIQGLQIKDFRVNRSVTEKGF